MNKLLTSVSVMVLTAGGATAGGLDRTGQPIQALFEAGGESGGYAELAFGRTIPRVSGEGVGIGAVGLPAGTKYDSVAESFNSVGGAVKMNFSDQWSGALIYDQSYGSDVVYPGDMASTELGGTSAIADGDSLTAYLRYKFNDRWSAHGGLRLQRIKGDIGLSGLAYGLPEATAQAAFAANMSAAQAAAAAGDLAAAAEFQAAATTAAGTVNGYSVTLEDSTALGWVIGGAYEIPEIAARVSLTYNSEISHNVKMKESGPDVIVGVDPTTGAPIIVPALDGEDDVEVKSPQSVNLEFRTGIAADTLLFGSIRWVDWSEFRIDPTNFTNYTGGGLVDLEDTTTYALGLGRRFNEQWAGSFAVSYEAAGDNLVSPLAPSTGLWALAIGASYTVDAFSITGGVRHTWLGDAKPETGTPDVARANFEGNNATSFGIRVGYNF
ncbi:long-subunit fatty acid transport protein [Aliiruegeria haliotis]|uniref:Long-subunit fatty acid transport protein n=1 Tax=Aliiruegeria haliotis TaxID=1280846 RepID=A0A2T0RYN2_9RHOB|nr:outer membrane protein transport protein [Aliiruegeria haliotis]PRY26284.1 long-subunit fatty acid transport protein [Aliiruegeria haliotis]